MIFLAVGKFDNCFGCYFVLPYLQLKFVLLAFVEYGESNVIIFLVHNVNHLSSGFRQ